tara:strand:+ start:71 stop:868 length:798 start_codon:yes stop_codon:yes gene_type:complete
MNKLFKFKVTMSICAVVYVWSLPLLSKIGFTENNSTSISAFIANPPATGAMAAVSFIPLTLVWEYQDTILENIPIVPTCTIGWICQTLYYSTAVYQISYGTFLICTFGYVKSWIHTTTVVVFCSSFMIHILITLTYSIPSKITKSILGIASSSSIVLIIMTILNIHNIFFWFFECIGISCMFIFTPIEWIIITNNNLGDSIVDTYQEQQTESYKGIFNHDIEMKEGLINNEFTYTHRHSYEGVFNENLQIREELVNRENTEQDIV